MKRLVYFLLLLGLPVLLPFYAKAQVQELEQLTLDIEKLAQMKTILQQMYKDYQILSTGYNTIKNIAKGNFSLHSTYLNGLLSVNPAIKNYVRVADIIAAQTALVSEYKNAYKSFQASGQFDPAELNYLTTVYSNLFNKSLDNLSELVMVLTDNTLRASDAERLTAIDRIYNDIQDKLIFLRMFDGRAGMLGAQRQHDARDNSNLQSLYGQ